MTRLVLVLLVAVGFALAMAGLRRGWLARARRQRDLVPTIPAVPGHLRADLAPELRGLYVGTTVATRYPAWVNAVRQGRTDIHPRTGTDR
jgi:hypothetical protein